MDDIFVFQEDHENGQLISNSLLSNSSNNINLDQSLYSNDIISTFSTTQASTNNEPNLNTQHNNCNTINNNINNLSNSNSFIYSQLQLQQFNEFNTQQLQHLQQQQQQQPHFNITQEFQQQYHQQQQLSDYSSPETNSSPITEPLTPYNGYQNQLLQQQTNYQQLQQTCTSSPEQQVTNGSPPTNFVSSSDNEKSSVATTKQKVSKKRKNGFDPSVDQGPDLNSMLLEISSEDFRTYKKNFYSSSSLSTQVKNLISSQFRKIKNRESAQRSREKKTKYTGEIEGELEKANQEIEELKQEAKRLKMENELLRKQNEAYQSSFNSQQQQNSTNSFLSSSSNNMYRSNDNIGFTSLLSNVFSSIGSSSSSVNSKKVLSIFIFAILLCSFMVSNPTFSAQASQQSSTSVSQQQNPIRPYSEQISNSYMNNNPNGGIYNVNQFAGRSPLMNDIGIDLSPRRSNIQTASFSPSSLRRSVSTQNLENDQQPQGEHDSTLINRDGVDDWSTGRQNSKFTVRYRKNSARQLLKSLEPNTVRSFKQQQQQQLSKNNIDENDMVIDNDDDNSSFYVDEDNNIAFLPSSSNSKQNILYLDNDDDPTNNHLPNIDGNLRSSRSTTTTTTTTTTSRPTPQLFNNSTFEMEFEPNYEIFQETNETGNKTSFVRLPGSSYNFKFLIDANNFQGSSEISKALRESNNQHIEFVSVLVQINKNKPL